MYVYIAGTHAYKFRTHATYFHVYTPTGMPVSATQVDSTTLDLLACNLNETSMCLENMSMQGRKWHASVTCKCITITDMCIAALLVL
jgi:hypothetical protein